MLALSWKPVSPTSTGIDRQCVLGAGAWLQATCVFLLVRIVCTLYWKCWELAKLFLWTLPLRKSPILGCGKMVCTFWVVLSLLPEPKAHECRSLYWFGPAYGGLINILHHNIVVSHLLHRRARCCGKGQTKQTLTRSLSVLIGINCPNQPHLGPPATPSANASRVPFQLSPGYLVLSWAVL